MSVTLKLVNGTEKELQLPDLSITVKQLKDLTAPVVDIPADEQRIVLKGKVLKDTDVLSAVGLEYGNAMHIVRSKKKDAAAPPPATSVAAPAPTPTPAAPATTASASASMPAANPYAALLGGGGFGAPAPGGASAATPAANPWGAPGGMPGYGASSDMNMAMQMMQNPMMMQLMQQSMSDPNFVEYLRQSDPRLANMSPEMLRMSMEMMASNPQLMSQMASMSGAAGGQQPGATAAAPGSAPPGMGYNFNPAAFAPVQPQGNPREIYAAQLQQLSDMGFPNEEANLAALQQSQGSVSFAIERLLGSLN